MSTEKTFKELLKEDANHAAMGVSLLRQKIEKDMQNDIDNDIEIEDQVISSDVKQSIALLHTTTDLMAKRFAPEHMQGKENAKKSDLYIANEKIRELQNQIGKESSLETIPHIAKSLAEEIRTKMENIGLWVSPDVSITEYSVLVELKHIGKASHDTRYARDEEDLLETKEQNKELDAAFNSNFDIVDEDVNSFREKIKITSRNINKIKDVMFDINNLSFSLDSLSNGRFNDTFDAIDSMSFNLSLDHIVFPKMYYGED